MADEKTTANAARADEAKNAARPEGSAAGRTVQVSPAPEPVVTAEVPTEAAIHPTGDVTNTSFRSREPLGGAADETTRQEMEVMDKQIRDKSRGITDDTKVRTISPQSQYPGRGMAPDRAPGPGQTQEEIESPVQGRRDPRVDEVTSDIDSGGDRIQRRGGLPATPDEIRESEDRRRNRTGYKYPGDVTGRETLPTPPEASGRTGGASGQPSAPPGTAPLTPEGKAAARDRGA